MSGAQPSYCYSSLDPDRQEIRLLAVQPRAQSADCGDPVRCSTRHVSLQEVPRPEYETISYVWGSAQSKDFLYLDGLRVTVLASAVQALQRLRWNSGEQERMLWIDAICIDQTNMKERAQQVASMGDIYRWSVDNHIYVGEDDGTFGSALQNFHNLFEEARRETDDFRAFWKMVYDIDRENWIRGKSALATKIDPEALVSFYSRPWFERIWVLQEIILPDRSTFHCGPLAINASIVLKATVWLEYKSGSIASHLQRCQGRHNTNDIAYIRFMKGAFEGTSPKTWSLKYILAMSTRFKATDPRDKIFAILDLLQSSTPAPKCLLGLLTPDYNKSVERVFRDATMFSIIASGSLQIFRNIYHRGDDALDLEGHVSWVPQWQREFDFRMDAYRLRDGSASDAALGTEVSSPIMGNGVPSDGLEVLPIRGFVVAIADRTTEVMSERTPLDDLRQAIGDIVLSQQKAERRFSNKSLAELLAKKHFYHNRRFFGTTGGYVGVGPRPLHTGDLVTVLYGTQWPVILRRFGNGYHFLGQCSVPGIMHGEAVREHRAKILPDELFMLH